MVSVQEQAKLIFADFKKRLGDHDFSSLSSTLKLSFYQRNYPEFAKSYPLVLRFMITEHFFSEKVLDEFLKKTYTMPNSSMEDFCNKQSYYVAIALRHQMESKTKKITKSIKKDIKEQRLLAQSQLLEEVQSIKSCDKSSVKEFTDIAEDIDKQRSLLLELAGKYCADK